MAKRNKPSFASADQKSFVKAFQKLTDRYPAWAVWSDFIAMFAIALSNVFDRAYYETREAQFRKTIERYNQMEQTVFPELWAIVADAFENNPEQDFLGSVYMELGLGNHWIGQFFTPYDVCACMAKITVTDAVEHVKKHGVVMLNDCACGAGVTLIAGVHEIRRQLSEAGYIWQNHILVSAQDIDYTTGLMCYIQLSLLGVAGFIKIGNTITDPMREGDNKENYWYTPMYFSDVWVMRRQWKAIDRLFQKQTMREVKDGTA